jgi:GntR family transcriptional repressor for pyruvate dehydrogenase complex
MSSVNVARRNVSVGIADRLRQRILHGRLQPGERLPGHRDLAASFSVSMGSVREAISMLISEGLVETRAGSGTFVAREVRPSQGVVRDYPLDRKQIEELIEAREVLEPRVVALAAQRASAEQVRRLWEAVEHMEETASDPRAFAEADVELHMAIAEASGNRFLMRATMDARSMIERDMELSAEVGIRRLGTLQFSVDAHRRLVAAIAAGEPEKARQIMLNILRRNHEFVLSLYSSGEVAMGAAGEL